MKSKASFFSSVVKGVQNISAYICCSKQTKLTGVVLKVSMVSFFFNRKTVQRWSWKGI